MRQVLSVTAVLILAVGAVVFGFAFFQANQEQLALSADLQYRTHILADSLADTVGPYYINHSADAIQNVVDRFADRDRLLGLAVYDNKGSVVAQTRALPSYIVQQPALVQTAMDSDTPGGTFLRNGSSSVYVFVEPLHDGTTVAGALMVAQDASYIDATLSNIWTSNTYRLLLLILILGIAMFFLVRWVFHRPLQRLAESVRSARTGEAHASPRLGETFFGPLQREISKMTTSLSQARHAASEEARMRLEKLDSPWTAERLKEFIKAYLRDRPIYVVSNREPYVHDDPKNLAHYSVPASGMVTALEPVMDATGGVWLAQGSGAADHETADTEGKLRVPPDDPRYTLKRVYLSKEDNDGFYTGFSNEALWPLCHVAHTRPIFRKEDWQAYRSVNGQFAHALLSEIKNVQRPIILVQDFHFALLPAMIKASRPDAQVALFWHIPWPAADVFSICPFRKELLEGMLGADILGFHTQQHCNNFMETVGKEIEARIDFEQFSIAREGHHTYIKPFPISIAFSGGHEDEPAAAPDKQALHDLGIKTEFVGLGVDRLDYTKGIVERLKGIEFFLDSHPEYRERFTFLQIAPISRESVAKYREYGEDVTNEVARINEKFSGNRSGWKPIVLEKTHYTHPQLNELYRLANVCLVTSLHDGMNLVAKEFVAARDDEAGVLILSNFTGASRDLKSALSLNPYSAEETAETILRALTMSPAEQHRRMRAMRAAVRDYNVYRWSAELIKAVANIE